MNAVQAMRERQRIKNAGENRKEVQRKEGNKCLNTRLYCISCTSFPPSIIVFVRATIATKFHICC